MLEIIYSNQFKKDFKKIRRLPLADLKIIFEVITLIEKENSIDTKYKDHKLTGNFANYRECHVKPDLLLIYAINKTKLKLARIGPHSELF